jgi:hypothetical protein
MKRFFIQSTVLTIIVFIVGTIVYSTILQPYYRSALPFTALFFYLATNLVHAYLLKISIKSGSRFTSQYMAVSFVLFFHLAVAVVYALLNREYAKIFLVNFLLLYAIYTAFEVLQFSKFVRQGN